jgi:BirA family biotin operon repressor/biotin-[acetyl-CoA-carboxylase] ligase
MKAENRGVKFEGDKGESRAAADSLRPEALGRALKDSLFGENIVFHETLDSTNRLAKELALGGAPEGTLVITEEQTLGRGRRGRTWLSPGGTNLLFSLLVRPPLSPDRAFSLTMILALAASDGVETVCGIGPLIKWPNDLFLGPKKLAGLLTEFSAREGAIEYAVLGIGLNVNWNPAEARDHMYPTTSLLAETGVKTDRTDLLVGILKRFERYYGEVTSGNLEDAYRRWNERSLILGRDVVIESAQGKILGKALRIDRRGALVIRDDRGGEREILVGDVSLRLPE